VAALAAAAFLVTLAFDVPGDLKLDLAHLAGTSVVFGALALSAASVAFLFGALAGRSVWGVAGGALVTALGYVFNAIGNQDASLAWLHHLSPYHWAFGGEPLLSGISVVCVLGLLAVSAVAVVLTLVVFRSRDVGV
jgi:ABC-2 type transport system permease protein